MITTYNPGISQSNAVLCLPVIPTILLSCYHDYTQYVVHTIANLSTQMKIARVILEIEGNVTNYLDGLFNQDIDNNIITLTQRGLVQNIIDTLHLDSNTSPFTSTYPYLYPTNNKLFHALQNYVLIVVVFE